jgi:hypothetical protein
MPKTEVKEIAEVDANTGLTNFSKEQQAEMLARQNEDVARLKEKLAVTGNAISLKNKQFKLPDGTILQGPVDVIVLDWQTRNSYYDKPYDEQNIAPPACWAQGEFPEKLAPNPEFVEDPVAVDCKSCPKNQYKSGATGKGKACTNNRRVIVRLPARKDLYVLTISPTSLKDFDNAMSSLLAVSNRTYNAIISMNFHPDKSWPQLVFDDARPNPNWPHDQASVENGEVQAILELKPEI